MAPDRIDLPFYDPDPRRVLISLRQSVEKKDISSPSDGLVVDPNLLALTVMDMTDRHLGSVTKWALENELELKGRERIATYLQLLTFWYFLFGSGVAQHLRSDQFTLFVLEALVNMMDHLRAESRSLSWLYGVNPFGRKQRIRDIEMELARLVDREEDYYVRDELNGTERQAVDRLVRVLAEGKEIPLVTRIIKLNYRLLSILGLPIERLTVLMTLHIRNSSLIISVEKEVVASLRPVWKCDVV